jgi:hypothetical protein
MLKPPILNKIDLTGWLVNGGLNPLIRDYDTLVRVANDEPDCGFGWPSLAEAMRHICIELNVTCWPWEKIHGTLSEFERRELFRQFLAKRDTPGWKHGKELLPGIWTTAQFIAKHGGKNAAAQCHDFADLLACLNLDQSVNNFNPWNVANQFKGFNRTGYINAENPNNWRDAFT